MKKVLLFSCDPGGANTIIPLYREFQSRKGYIAVLYGKDSALVRYRSFGLKGKDITKIIDTSASDEIENFIIREKPDYIITGTSAEDMTEKYIWKASTALRIPSFAIIDQWVNYGVRFSRFGVSELKKYNRVKTHEFLPTKIFLMDEYAKKELIQTGIKANKAVVSGQPYFDLFLEHGRSQTDKKIRNFKHKYGINQNDFLITFASEPIQKTYKENDRSEHYWGYTEATILKALIESLTKMTKNDKLSLTLAIRPHPKEELDSYEKIIKNNKHLKLLLLKECNGWDLISSSDLVCGMSSMFLIEAAIFGKPVVSIQIGLKRKDPFILARRKIINSITSKKRLDKVLRASIIKGENPGNEFKVIQGASKNIINHLEKFYA